MLELVGRSIKSVKLIDDDEYVRSNYREYVEDMELAAEEVKGPIRDFTQLLQLFDFKHDAAVCDFDLKTKNYSSWNGDEVVASLYRQGVPAVLCTRWDGHLPQAVRNKRRSIPVVVSPTNFSPEALLSAFTLCLREFRGEFSEHRKPWRALVRVESAETFPDGHFRLNLIVPGWNPNSGLTFVYAPGGNTVLEEVRSRVQKGEIVRAFAQVNLGAETADDVYVEEWSFE
jgi:hypothetical protein